MWGGEGSSFGGEGDRVGEKRECARGFWKRGARLAERAIAGERKESALAVKSVKKRAIALL